MTPLQSHAAKLLPLIQALADGKHLIRDVDGVQARLCPIADSDAAVKGTLSYLAENYDCNLYRIKTELTWRAWTGRELDNLPMHTVFRFGPDTTVYVMSSIHDTGEAILCSRKSYHSLRSVSREQLFLAWEHSTDAGKTWKRCGVPEEGT